jgi:hypothetical protein
VVRIAWAGGVVDEAMWRSLPRLEAWNSTLSEGRSGSVMEQ